MGMDTSKINIMSSSIIVCTRDLDYGAGIQIKNELNQFDLDRSIDKIIVIGPKKLEGCSSKVEFEIIPTKGKFFVTKEPYFAFKCNQKIKKIIKREKIDRIYLHFPIFAKPYGVETIRKVHLLHKSIIRHYPKNIMFAPAYFFHYLYSYFDLRTIRYSSSVHFVGKRIMMDAEYFYPEYRYKFQYHPNQVDKNRFFRVSEKERIQLKKEMGLNDNKINILFVGRLEPLKGINLIINTLADIKTVNARLIVIGDGPMKDKIAVCPFVKYIGKVEHAEMNRYYNISDLFVMPSYYETFSLTVFEASACGCKILSREVGDVKSVLEKDSLFTDDEEGKQKLIKFISCYPVKDI